MLEREWVRLIAEPTASDVEKRGVATLYESTRFARCMAIPAAFRMISAALDTDGRSAVSALDGLQGLYGVIVSSPWPWLRIPKSGDGVWIPGELLKDLSHNLTQVRLMELAPQIRAAIILLLLPTWQYVGKAANVDTATGLSVIQASRYAPTKRDLAHSEAAALALPPDADSLLREWIDRTSSPIVGL